MIDLIVVLLVLLVVFAFAWAILSRIPLPDPLNWMAPVLIGLLLLIILLAYALPYLRAPLGRLP